MSEERRRAVTRVLDRLEHRVWRMRNGTHVRLLEMGDSHLRNAAAMCYRRAARIENSVVTSPALGRGSFAEMHVDHAADAQFVKSSRIRGAATAMLTYAIARGSYLRAHDGIVVW